MTSGQKRAVLELERLSASGPLEFEIVQGPHLVNEWLVATVSLRIGAIETREGGLDLREREEFLLYVPPGFPFDRPHLRVAHTRFAGFPHVIWVKTICLYQSSIDWNPSDGLYGFFDRLLVWLGKAAINEMDPLGGPLEPPHHDTDFTQKPFVIRADAPCSVGEEWVGLAILERHENRIEIVGWNDLAGEWPVEGSLAFAVMLPRALPMEFPTSGAALFRELERAGMHRGSIVRNLALAAVLAPEGEAIHLVVGLPMRRAADGSQRLHIAVWSTDAEKAHSLRSVLPKSGDTVELLALRDEIKDTLTSIFELSNIKWCQVFEDRQEIIVRRDTGTPVSMFAGKKILILGCGALGAWAAEIIARAKPKILHLVDNSKVKPGVLARQNFALGDIGWEKAYAIARRMREVAYRCEIVPHSCEAYSFIHQDLDRFREFDIVLDCTASSILQMKLEKSWAEFGGRTPQIISLVIDGQASHCLSTIIPKNSLGGIWDGYLGLKRALCIDANCPKIVQAFYSKRAMENLFQPEPGCSDPTFVGSTADVVALLSGALNIAADKLQNKKGKFASGIAFSVPKGTQENYFLFSRDLPQFCETTAGNYRVRIAESVFSKARAWVRQNSRLRSLSHETGGLLWGVWDDAVEVVWISDLSGPPRDSRHDPQQFQCGIEGTLDEHNQRMARTHAACGFVGHWHTHPNLPSRQSGVDMANMATLVSTIGQNQRRSVMLIFGRTGNVPTAGIYVYESRAIIGSGDLVSVGSSQVTLERSVI